MTKDPPKKSSGFPNAKSGPQGRGVAFLTLNWDPYLLELLAELQATKRALGDVFGRSHQAWSNFLGSFFEEISNKFFQKKQLLYIRTKTPYSPYNFHRFFDPAIIWGTKNLKLQVSRRERSSETQLEAPTGGWDGKLLTGSFPLQNEGAKGSVLWGDENSALCLHSFFFRNKAIFWLEEIYKTN